MSNETQKFLLDRKAQLEAELAMVNAGLRADGVRMPTEKATHKVRGRPPSGKKTIPQQILEILKENPNGLKTTEIRERINGKYGRNITKIGCSSYLSNMKRDGLVDFDDVFMWTKK